MTAALSVAALILELGFVAALVMLHFVDRQFGPRDRFVSEYVLGRWGWLMRVAFACHAGAATALGAALATERDAFAPIGGALVAYSLAIVVVAWVPTDPSVGAVEPTAHGRRHRGAADLAQRTAAVTGVIAVVTPAWLGDTPRALTMALLAGVLLPTSFLVVRYRHRWRLPPGLVQRWYFAVIAAWTMAVAVALRAG